MMNKVPVIMYHSVGVADSKWVNNNLTINYKVFESHLQWLKKNNYKTLKFDDLYNYIFFNSKIPAKSIILTFDDGYLDNYVFAYPLLKKYGFCGCIFPSTDFIEDGAKREVYINKIDNLEHSGYLHWSELIEMEQSNVFEVQCHAKTHTFYPHSTKIIDFRNHEDRYYWMTWNQYENLKPKLFYDDDTLINVGEPVFEFSPSLSKKRIFIDDNFIKRITDIVQNESSLTRNNEELKKKLLHICDSLKTNKIYRVESDEEYYKRIQYELFESKTILEKKLNKKITVLCWPHGSATEIGVNISNELGFKLNTAGRDILNIRAKISNSPMHKTNRVYRLSPAGSWNHKYFRLSKYSYLKGKELGIRLKMFSSTKISNLFIKILHKLVVLKHKLSVKIVELYQNLNI